MRPRSYSALAGGPWMNSCAVVRFESGAWAARFADGFCFPELSYSASLTRRWFRPGDNLWPEKELASESPPAKDAHLASAIANFARLVYRNPQADATPRTLPRREAGP